MRTRTEITRSAIIRAARWLFLHRGYTATSVEAIALQAGVTKQTVYGYFVGKRDLFVCVIEDVIGQPWSFDPLQDTVATVDDLKAELLRVGMHINKVISKPDYIQLLRVVIAETIADPGLGLVFERGVTARSLRALTALFTDAKKSGIIHIEQPVVAAQMFMGGFVTRIFLEGLLMQSRSKSIKKQTKQELQQYVDEFMRRAG